MRFLRCFAVLGLAVLLPVTAIGQECGESRVQGENDAAYQHSSAGWFLAGFGSGIFLGLIGTGVIAGAAAMTKPQPSRIPPKVIKSCYINGYSRKAKNKNALSALGGGLLGTIVLYVSAQSD